MRNTINGKENTSKPIDKENLILLERKQATEKLEPVTVVGMWLRFGKEVTSVEYSTHEEFRRFIENFLELEGDELDTWDLVERCDVLNFILENSETKPEMFVPINTL